MQHSDTDPTRIWLCDLTYTQQTISSDIMPAAVGGIATFTESYLDSPVDIRIFKFPEKLAEAFDTEAPPHIIGFSNYAWNRDLSARFAAVIKRKLPSVVTVFGGPNYPTTEKEQEAFLRDHDMVDFYLVKEGEAAFAKLAEALIARSFDTALVPLDVPSVHRITKDGRFHASETIERIFDLTQIPSPYLSGKLDEFFDGVMLPIIQTNRGCPFRCTFCVEGMSYYSRVAKNPHEKIAGELRYIADRMVKTREGGRMDLHIADSNFGMYKEDMAICRTVAELQKSHGFPEYINVATGKNHKKRVLEAARTVNGALRLSGAVQSLDSTILENIERSNINEEELMSLALEASEVGANSYSEIILALPGDTREAHFKTIQRVVEADFNTVCLYQLMLLPGTDLASAASVKKWEMETKFRILPRCYGHFDCLGEEINAAEIEEICVSNSSLTLEDYYDCRRFHLVINVFYNDGVFKEVLRLLKMLGLPKFEWLERIYAYRGNAVFNDYVGEFLQETESEVWEDRDALEAFIRDRGNIKRYINGDFGANLIFKYRSIAFIRHVDAMANVASATLREMLEQHDALHALPLGLDLIEFSRLRMRDVFEHRDRIHEAEFSYAVDEFAQDIEPDGVQRYKLDVPRAFSFEFTDQQRQTMSSYLSIYGTTLAGLSRILAKVYVRRMFRIPTRAGMTVETLSRQDGIIGDGQLTGLNEFA